MCARVRACVHGVCVCVCVCVGYVCVCVCVCVVCVLCVCVCCVVCCVCVVCVCVCCCVLCVCVVCCVCCVCVYQWSVRAGRGIAGSQLGKSGGGGELVPLVAPGTLEDSLLCLLVAWLDLPSPRLPSQMPTRLEVGVPWLESCSALLPGARGDLRSLPSPLQGLLMQLLRRIQWLCR